MAKKLNTEERLKREMEARVGSDHVDSGKIKLFPVPLIILGGMFFLQTLF